MNSEIQQFIQSVRRHNPTAKTWRSTFPYKAILGHKKLETTLIYARVHDRTVEQDFFTAMNRVEFLWTHAKTQQTNFQVLSI